MKKIWILICTAALLFALCACTDQKQEEASTTGTKESTDVTDPSGTEQDTDPTENTGTPVEVNPGNDAADGWTNVY